MAAGKLCPQNRCPLFIHKGMQISPSTEWTLRTDPHGTHTHTQMCIEGCTAMQLPLKEKQAGLMTRPTRTAVLFVCVRVCASLFVCMCVSFSTCGRQGSFSTMTTTTKKFGLSVKSSNHTHPHPLANTARQLKHLVLQTHHRAKNGVVISSWLLSYFFYQTPLMIFHWSNGKTADKYILLVQTMPQSFSSIFKFK